MARRHHYKRRTKGDAHEIDVTTFLNLMVVLVPFLLITAVFSRLTIVELDLPSSAGGPSSGQENFRVEVIVREELIEISNGTNIIASIPNKDEDFDLQTLSDFMIELKLEYPEHDEASVLMEAQIPYDYLIQVMDIVRSVELPVNGDGESALTAGTDAGIDTGIDTGVDAVFDIDAVDDQEYQLFALFSEISVGDAP